MAGLIPNDTSPGASTHRAKLLKKTALAVAETGCTIQWPS
jgi:hypothetical protein